MPRENPESSVQGDPLCIPKPSLWGGKETQNLAEAAGAAPSQHGVAGGLGERELPGSGAGQGEPCAQTLSSVWVWAARPIKHAIIHHGAEALRRSQHRDGGAQRMFCAWLQRMGRTRLVKGFAINPTCDCDGLRLWITSEKWCLLVQENWKRLPLGHQALLKGALEVRRCCAQKLFSFLQVLFFAQLEPVLDFCREYWFVCFGIQWEFQFLHILQRPVKVQSLPGLVLRAAQWTEEPKALWNCHHCHCQSKGGFSGTCRQGKVWNSSGAMRGNLDVGRLL